VGAPRLHFYGSAGTVKHVAHLLARDCAPGELLDGDVQQSLNLEVHIVREFQSYVCGPYRVTTFPANHDPEVEPLLYAVASMRRTIFYGTDTAALSEEVWQSFHRFSLRFDLVILDHTYGPGEPASDHLNARQCAEHAERFRREGLLTDGARVLATHIAHEGNPPHPELEAYALLHGYEVAHDGLVV
jgi:phosphoribosyl 1,2-cyclic phosphodiesterase